uniref:Uncharacterized protein n=1 Tax=Arundo donax TaxID=35708 RepID=A0A0A9DQI1_ARUDO
MFLYAVFQTRVFFRLSGILLGPSWPHV